ncbi:MAG: lactate utilization protein, partial [Gammaproteobacteria bacterium]|nr:lactate utilization protein [Gammaproteobacteria bacterium]
MSARNNILSALRARASSEQVAPVEYQSGAGSADLEHCVATFRARAADESATTTVVDDQSGVAEEIGRYLSEQGLPEAVHAFGEAADIPGLQRRETELAADGEVVVTGCFAGIAEAGAVVLVSTAGYPAQNHFLARTHIVVLPAAKLVPDYESLWSRTREVFAEGWPRMMNWIVGPSRTADLGVPSRL